MQKLTGIACVLALTIGCQKHEDAKATPGQTRAPAQVQDKQAPGAQSQDELNLPVAKIDDITITLGELQDRINRQSPYIRAKYTSPELRKEFLDSLVRFEILAKEAYRRGFDKDPEVVRTMKQVMIQKLMRDEFDSKITADTITDDEMKKYYDASVADYVKPEEVRASAIILKTKAQADRVLLEAKGDAGKTNKGFRDLVGKYSSDEETKLRGGDLRYFNAQTATKDVPAPVVKAAFALAQTGDVSAVVDGGNGNFYILKQTGRRKALTKGFDDAKSQIRSKLFREKRQQAQKDFVDNLKSQAKIEVNEAALSKVKIDTSNAPGDDRKDLMPPPAPGAGSGSGSASTP